MDFSAVFQFFSQENTLTPERRAAELFCVCVTALLLAAALGILLYRKIKKQRADRRTDAEDRDDTV